MNFSLVIPLWNEEKNINDLVSAIVNSELLHNHMQELILVNNGSVDNTGTLIDQAAQKYSWITPVHLKENLNYGGGIYEGFKYARSEVFCYIPGDLQIIPEDVVKISKVFQADIKKSTMLLVKGWRTTRHDPFQTRFVSVVYTFLANLILGLQVKDVNGLPKMFHRSLIDHIPTERMKTFVFDSQIISIAKQLNWQVKEIPVTFYSRRQGVSSWSRKRIQMYINIFKQLLRLRTLRNAKGVPLERLK